VHPSENISILSLSAGSQGWTAPLPASNPSAIAVALARFALAFIGACVWEANKGGGDDGNEDDSGAELADEEEEEEEEEDADTVGTSGVEVCGSDRILAKSLARIKRSGAM
jgi:hypothetical protein